MPRAQGRAPGTTCPVQSAKPWEYGLGDKGYVGCPQIITEWKGDGLTRRQIEFNLTLQHYRGRVEHLISEMVQSRRALNTRWHGSFSLLAAVMKITAHMVGLQERMKASAVRCVWPVASVPPHIQSSPGIKKP